MDNVIRRYFDTAQICENGHVITIHHKSLPVESKKFCPTCNAKTISKCPNCNAELQGCYHADTERLVSYNYITPGQEKYSYATVCLTDFQNYTVPAYCYNCGEPYPWTSKFFEAANEMVDMFDDLTQEQKQTLKSTFPDLVVESPNSQLAALKASKIINGLQEFGKDIFINLLSENIIPTLFTLMQLK